MSRIVVTAVGYLGDIAPYVEPARRLARAGHDVVFVAPAGYRSILIDEPFTFVEHPGDLSAAAMHADPRHERLLRHPTINSPRLARYYINGYFLADPQRATSTWIDLLAGADAVVTHVAPAAVVVPIAKRLGVPSVVGTVVPMLLPTDHRMAPFTPGPQSLGRLSNHMSWVYSDWALHATYGGPELNRLRVRCGLQKVRAPGLHSYRDADRLVSLVPEAFAGPAWEDWPPFIWGGFSHWAPTAPEMPDDVQAFLDDGDPPVMVTLGSSAAAGAEASFAAIADAVTELGRRALVVTGTERLRDAARAAIRPNRHVMCAAFVPLAPAISRSCGAVISGSLGTVGIALHAATPAVVVPTLFDQRWNGRRMQQLGLGRVATKPRAIRSALSTILTDETYRTRSQAMAETIREDDGAQAITDVTQDLLRAPRDKLCSRPSPMDGA